MVIKLSETYFSFVCLIKLFGYTHMFMSVILPIENSSISWLLSVGIAEDAEYVSLKISYYVLNGVD